MKYTLELFTIKPKGILLFKFSEGGTGPKDILYPGNNSECRSPDFFSDKTFGI